MEWTAGLRGAVTGVCVAVGLALAAPSCRSSDPDDDPAGDDDVASDDDGAGDDDATGEDDATGDDDASGDDDATGDDDASGDDDATPDPCDPAVEGAIGDPCTSPADCVATPGEPYCNAAWPGGYCLDGSGGNSDNCDLSDPLSSCGAPCLVCASYPYYPAGRCYTACDGHDDCRDGYACQPDATGAVMACFPSW